MSDYIDNDIFPADWEPQDTNIKVIGVGGGGCNAVTYMYNQKIEGCSFMVCNTDSQALAKSTVPVKIQLGEGLGAGTDPEKARKAAIESQDRISKAIGKGTKILFITAGLGGGTGTGAAPTVAKIAKELGILTVAVVTLPFEYEGTETLSKAKDGVTELRQYVDSLLIINNEKLYEYFGDQLIQDAFPKADEVLATAVRGIVEVIEKPGHINVDLEDARTMLKNSGMALMGCGVGSGPNRLEDAIKGALESPLLNNYDLKTTQRMLINITVSRNEKGLSMIELCDLSKKILEYTGNNIVKFKRGIIWNEDPNADDTIYITVIATGFKADMSIFADRDLGKIIPIFSDFEYQPITDESQESGEIQEAEDEPVITKIGFDSDSNRPRFHFDAPPVLIVKEGDDRAELEMVSAYARSRA